jgi:hypothetical protein
MRKGRRRSGKDTLADLLVSREGYVRVQESVIWAVWSSGKPI